MNPEKMMTIGRENLRLFDEDNNDWKLRAWFCGIYPLGTLNSDFCKSMVLEQSGDW